MSTSPLVSVCIPSYNASQYIGHTIQSVLDSTYSNVEIIVSDDASTDDTRDIVGSFSDPRLHLYANEKTLGPAGNWNRALSRASGELVGLLNHDDLYGPFLLTLAVRAFSRHAHIGWFITAYTLVNEDSRRHAGVCFSETGCCERKEAFVQMATFRCWSPAYIARRDILIRVGYYDEEMGPCADTDLYLRLASHYPLYYSSNPHHAAWRGHSHNLTYQLTALGYYSRRFAMLDKVFADPSLPEELLACKNECYVDLRHVVEGRIQMFLEQGDESTARQLTELLKRRP